MFDLYTRRLEYVLIDLSCNVTQHLHKEEFQSMSLGRERATAYLPTCMYGVPDFLRFPLTFYSLHSLTSTYLPTPLHSLSSPPQSTEGRSTPSLPTSPSSIPPCNIPLVSRTKLRRLPCHLLTVVLVHPSTSRICHASLQFHDTKLSVVAPLPSIPSIRLATCSALGPPHGSVALRGGSRCG
jgi:hypothetical protein